jgi:MFS transporter, DHA1 family, inner membrane transport protein
LNYLAVVNLFLLLFLGLADNQMIAALLPTLTSSLHITISKAGLLVVVYSIAAAASSFVSGTLSDHHGRRVFLLGGVILFAAASAAASFSNTFPRLLAMRILTGFAAGTISTCSIAYAGDGFPYEVRGKAIGLISSAYFIAPILGVPLAAQIAGHFGWQRAFLFFACLAVGVFASSLTLEKDAPVQFSEDKLRATISSFRTFLSRRDIVAALVVAFLVSGGLVGFLTYIGQWLNLHFGLSTGSIGWVFMLGGLVAVAGAPLGGILSDHWGKRNMSIASNVLLAAAMGMVPFFSWGVLLLVFVGLTSLGAAFRQGPLTALMTEMVPTEQRGAFIAMRNISSQCGIGSVVFVSGFLFERHGYASVTTLCAGMTVMVAILLLTHIAEPVRHAAKPR